MIAEEHSYFPDSNIAGPNDMVFKIDEGPLVGAYICKFREDGVQGIKSIYRRDASGECIGVVGIKSPLFYDQVLVGGSLFMRNAHLNRNGHIVIEVKNFQTGERLEIDSEGKVLDLFTREKKSKKKLTHSSISFPSSYS